MEQLAHSISRRLRTVALALPETSEGSSCVNRAFRVRQAAGPAVDRGREDGGDHFALGQGQIEIGGGAAGGEEQGDGREFLHGVPPHARDTPGSGMGGGGQ